MPLFLTLNLSLNYPDLATSKIDSVGWPELNPWCIKKSSPPHWFSPVVLTSILTASNPCHFELCVFKDESSCHSLASFSFGNVPLVDCSVWLSLNDYLG